MARKSFIFLILSVFACSAFGEEPINIPDPALKAAIEVKLRIIYVDDDSPADFNNIQAAIDDANNGDTVLVAPGTYTGDGNLDIDFKGKAIIVCSTDPNDLEITASTIINCQNNGRGFIFKSGEQADSILEGITIIHGKAQSGSGILINESSPTISKCVIRDCSGEYFDRLYGGGISILSGNPLIINCAIRNNAALYEGAGIYSENSSPVVTNCIIENNRSEYGQGSGISHYGYGNPLIIKCTIRGNSTSSDGGGIAIVGDFDIIDGQPEINDCLVIGNTSDKTGGGIYIQDNNALIRNCKIANNNASEAGGLHLGGTGTSDRYILYLEHCRITGNTGKSRAGGLDVTLCTLKMDNCIISGNSTFNGVFAGGLSISNWTIAEINNCSITGNKVNKYPGRRCIGGGIYLSICDVSIANSIINNNQAEQGAQITINPQIDFQSPVDPPIEKTTNVALHYNNFKDKKNQEFYIYGILSCLTLDMSNNLIVDPCFFDPGFWDANSTPNDSNDDFWIEGDYHLKSQAGRWDPNTLSWVQDDVTSPCIDAGDPNSDWVEELWPHGKRINMGAYGGTAQASMSLSDAGDIMDLNNDDLINWDDVLQFADKWDSNNVPIKEDLDRNGIVDANDLVYFFGNWENGSNNIPPVLDLIEDKHVTINNLLSFTVSALDNDDDELIYIALGLPGGAAFSEQTFNWTPEQTGTYFVTFIVSDCKSLDYATVKIVVE